MPQKCRGQNHGQKKPTNDAATLTIKVWRLRVGKTTADNYIHRGPRQPQKTQLEQFAHHCLVSQPHTNANTRSILPHHNTKTHRKQRPAIISNTVPKKHHPQWPNTPTPYGHGAAANSQTTCKTKTTSLAQPIQQPERHGAFFLEILSPSYGTLLGAALATPFGAISRDQVCDRLSSSIAFGTKQSPHRIPTTTTTKG